MRQHMWQPDFTATEHSADHHGGIAIEEAAQVAEARVGNWGRDLGDT